MRIRILPLLTAFALIAGACGSTVQSSSPKASGLGADHPASPDETAGTDGTSGLEPESRTGGASLSGRSPSGTSGTRSATTGSGASTKVRGVTAKEIYIGIPYAVNSSAVNESAGLKGVTRGDEREESSALIADVNARGGVLGRKIVPVWYEVDALTNDDAATMHQAMCEYFTHDHEVFAVFYGGNEQFIKCASDAGLLLVHDNLAGLSEDVFRKYPYYFEISTPNLDRLLAAQVPALAAQGYFSPWNTATGSPGTARAKVGVVSYDLGPFRRAVEKTLLPALAKAGYPPQSGDVIYVYPASRQSDLGVTSAQVSSAVLRLASDGVTHVLIVDLSSAITLFFAQTADSQRYFPRYGLNSQNGAQVLIDTGIAPGQFRGAKGIGFLPILDIRPAENSDDGPYSNDARRRCVALMKKYGQEPADANAKGAMLLSCNQHWLFQEAMRLGGPSISRDAFMTGVHRLGSSFQSGVTFRTRFSPSQHEGASGIRHWAFDESCGCMRYTSDVKDF
ncbi:MAG: hypothetical protein WDA71_13715 [Actinomycetota bacterium]